MMMLRVRVEMNRLLTAVGFGVANGITVIPDVAKADQLDGNRRVRVERYTNETVHTERIGHDRFLTFRWVDFSYFELLTRSVLDLMDVFLRYCRHSLSQTE